MNALGQWALVAASVFLVTRALAGTRDPLPRDQVTPHTRLLLAQMLKIEAENNAVDHQAIPFTLLRWWNRRGRNVSFDQLVRDYSSGFHDDAPPRAIAIRAMRWEDFSPSIRATVEAFLDGRLRDTSNGAVHWAARSIDRSTSMREVTPEGASNRFWRYR